MLWKGKNLRDYGIVVEEKPTFSKGKKNIDIYTIPGRSGFLSVDNGTYESFVMTVPCHFNENYDIDKIKEFLDGYGTISLDGLREYTGVIQNSISFEKILMFKKFVIQFLVNPFCEDIIPTEYNLSQNDAILNIEGSTTTMFPTIEITGTGTITITINNKTFKLIDIDGKYVLDCKAKVITQNGNNASHKMQYDFPFLVPGENNISYIGSITEFKIIYRKAYL